MLKLVKESHVPNRLQSAVQSGFAENGLHGYGFDGLKVPVGARVPKTAGHHLLWDNPFDPLPGGYRPQPALLESGSVSSKARMLYRRPCFF